MRVSLYCPHTSPEPTATAWWVALASSLDADVWFGHNLQTSLLAGVGYASGRGHRTSVGQGVILTPTTNAFASAAELSGLHRVSGQRVKAYFSPGYPALQQHIDGYAWARPLHRTRVFLDRLRERLHELQLSPQIELGLGVLRPRMARLSGEIADGALTWLVGADYLHDVLRPELLAGATETDRRPPRLVASLHTDLSEQGTADPETAAGTALAGHLLAPHYRDLLHRQGVAPGSSRNGHGQALLEAGLFVQPHQVAEQLQTLRRAGADEVTLVLHGLSGPDAVERARTFWARQVHDQPLALTPGRTS